MLEAAQVFDFDILVDHISLLGSGGRVKRCNRCRFNDEQGSVRATPGVSEGSKDRSYEGYLSLRARAVCETVSKHCHPPLL